MLRAKNLKKLFSTLLIILLTPLYCYAEDTPLSILSSSQTKISLIAIDPGLGGKEVGPSGCDRAKDINLQVARNVAERIKNDLGIDVILTRENDVYVPIEERSAIANNKGADLLISIQINGASDRSASGIETYFLKLSYEQDSIAKAVHENPASAKQSKDLETVLSDLIQSNKSAASESLADNVQKNVCQQLEKENKVVKNRGIKQAPFDVLLGARMPAISVYIGFLTNVDDCNHLSSHEYQDNISIGVVNGIQSFIEQMSTQQRLSADRQKAGSR